MTIGITWFLLKTVCSLKGKLYSFPSGSVLKLSDMGTHMVAAFLGLREEVNERGRDTWPALHAPHFQDPLVLSQQVSLSLWPRPTEVSSESSEETEEHG